MKYFSFLAFTAFMFTWMACSDGKSVDETGTTLTSQPLTPVSSTTQPQIITTNIDSQSKPTVTTSSVSTAAGLNPAHGQPGHRCDIAVGAPLNSKPAEQTTPTITTSPATQPFTISTDKPSQPAATTAVAPGMNPAHGQPGHRCDIAVGAPLSTPVSPTYKPPTANSETAPINITTDQAAKPEVTPAGATIPVVAAGTNPPHGQPGHRCDLAVGAPLNTKQTAPSVAPQAPVTNQIIPSIVPVKPTTDTKKENR